MRFERVQGVASTSESIGRGESGYAAALFT